MNLTNFKSDLEAALKKLAGVQAVGTIWFGFDPLCKPAGVQLFSGQELSREAYPKHWELINSGKRTLVTEEEWQEMVANQGFCQFYSSGNGSTTYRMPLIKGVHPKIVSALAEAGQHVEAGLPNITGTASARDSGMGEVTSGAFYQGPKQAGFWFYQDGSSSSECFDASLSNPIYGNSDTVQPEALTMVVGEWVVGVSMPVGTSDAESLLASVTTLESNVGALQNGSGFSAAGKAEIVGWGMPDWSTKVKPSGLQYTATYRCWLIGYAYSYNGEQAVSVNGNPVSREGNDYSSVQMLLDVGDVVQISAGEFVEMYVYALKGA